MRNTLQAVNTRKHSTVCSCLLLGEKQGEKASEKAVEGFECPLNSLSGLGRKKRNMSKYII